MQRRRNKWRAGATSVRERSYRHIKKLISDGILKTGLPISEFSLAKELGSSCAPIREAMKAMSEHIQASQRERLNEYDSWRREATLRQHHPGMFDSYAPAKKT